MKISWRGIKINESINNKFPQMVFMSYRRDPFRNSLEVLHPWWTVLYLQQAAAILHRLPYQIVLIPVLLQDGNTDDVNLSIIGKRMHKINITPLPIRTSFVLERTSFFHLLWGAFALWYYYYSLTFGTYYDGQFHICRWTQTVLYCLCKSPGSDIQYSVQCSCSQSDLTGFLKPTSISFLNTSLVGHACRQYTWGWKCTNKDMLSSS